MSKKLNFEFTDDDGNKYKFSVLGNINKDKILKFLEITNMLDQSSNKENNFPNINTTFGKLYSLLENKFNDNVIVAKLDKLISWSRSTSVALA